MLVAALQMQPAGTIEANLAGIENAAAAAAAFGAKLLVTPEMGVTGYAIWDDIRHLAETRAGPIIQRLTAIAAAHHITIVAGFPEREGETIYNAAALIKPDGAAAFYRKCHLFGPLEKAAFSPAAELSPIVQIGDLNIGMLICYDVEFPEMVRCLVLAGATMIVVPTALPRGAPANRVSSSMIQTRAFENHVFLVYADLCGEENATPYQGGSIIAAPDGEVLARAGDGASLLITDIDPQRYDAAGLDPYLQDRRPELYRGLR
jgi:predicted amidohydrolase